MLTPPMRPGRAAFSFIFLTVALDMLALGIMIPVWPRLVMQLEGGDMARAAFMTGVSGFLWAAMQFAFSPVLGALSDRIGRRPVVLLSNLGLGLDYVLMALAPTMGWLLFGRVLSGITSASFSTASAYIADVTPPEKRAGRFGMLGAAFGLGFVIGPAVGGVLGGIDVRLPFWISAALSLANAAYGFFILPESLPPERRAPRLDLRRAQPFATLQRLLRAPTLKGFAVVAFVSALAHESLPHTFVLSSVARYGWTERDTGLGLMAVGIVSVIVSGGVVRPTVRRLGERKAVYFGYLTGALGFALYAIAPTGALFFVGVPFAGLWSVSGPALQALMSREMPADEQGALQGALSSLRGIADMIGPLLFTRVMMAGAEATGSPAGAGAPFLLSALLLGFGCVLLARVRPSRSSPGASEGDPISPKIA
jgi:DHA1 family tetracycline resistance protein-like MFS transporter